MKIWCDVCDKEEATLFCSADEAALCEGCDRRVHHANKLAIKHSRFSLLHPTFKESPFCDICQERREFLFCQEDRAILCRECDLPIHRANEHTQKHNRFLVTGVKLSSSTSSSSSSFPCFNQTSSSSDGYAATVGSESKSSRSSKRFRLVSNNEIFSSPSIEKPLPSAVYRAEDNYTSDTASISTSSITVYLMETLPGWRVGDFLEPPLAASGFCKSFESNTSSFTSEKTWVPEVSPQSPQLSLFNPGNGLVDGFNSFKEANGLKYMAVDGTTMKALLFLKSALPLLRSPDIFGIKIQWNVCSISLSLGQCFSAIFSLFNGVVFCYFLKFIIDVSKKIGSSIFLHRPNCLCNKINKRHQTLIITADFKL